MRSRGAEAPDAVEPLEQAEHEEDPCPPQQEGGKPQEEYVQRHRRRVALRAGEKHCDELGHRLSSHWQLRKVDEVP